tara:strand:+ start:398 stop:1537 length:1140 start_codon:yes stop_codon:yes gene_type:complete
MLIVMILFQYVLDKNRKISKHCLIRNTIILFSIQKYTNTKQIFYLIIPFIIEFIIEYYHSKGISIDPLENKVKNMYSYFSIFWSPCMGKNDDLTEGKFDNNISKDFDDAQRDKKLELVALSGASKNVKILEVGCGNGSLLSYIKDTGADVYGITISKEQYELCKQKGLPVGLINFFDLDESHNAKYDSIICSGVIEHLPNVSNRQDIEVFYKNLFFRFQRLLNPHSTIKKIIITCIHFRDYTKLTDPWSRFNIYMLERANGGWYPTDKDCLVRSANQYFNLEYRRDITNDYYISTYHWAKKFIEKGPKTLLYQLVNSIINFVNNPYYIHIIIEKLYSWQWQFSDKNHSILWDLLKGKLQSNLHVTNSPVIHQLLVFKMK